MIKKLLRKRVFTCLYLIVFCGLLLCLSSSPVQAEAGLSTDFQEDVPENAECLDCHSQPNWEWKLANGDVLDLSIDPGVFGQSVHKEMQCVECHIGYDSFPAPHNQITAENKREYMISYHDTCEKCHSAQFDQVSDSVHDELFLEGNLETPICSDCHQPHSQIHMDELDAPRENGHLSWDSQICESCHEAEFEQYKDSVHGTGLLAENNEDMPECVDCHNVHLINNPTQSQFRLDSVDMCAKCHTNTDLMAKYGIETNVLDTYLVFHDTTVTLLEDYDPNSMTNKPTCYDCHGIHNVGDIEPPAIEANISALTLYPGTEVEKSGPPIENVGITGLIVGILIGSIGALTISQLIKEKRQENIDEQGTQS